MNRTETRRGVLGALAALFLIGAGGTMLAAGNTATAAGAALSSNIKDYVADKLDDFTATMHVKSHDDEAGRKINKDFGLVYKLKGDIQVKYKEENRLRLDANVAANKATLIVNGTKQYVHYFGINQTSNLGDSPGKRKTLLDVGLLSNGYLAYTEAQYLGPFSVNGVECAKFRISYRDKSLDTSHRMVWIDPKTRLVVKREEYSQGGKLNAIFLYKNPFKTPEGVWFPTLAEAYNSDNQKAGVLEYKNIKVNVGLDDSVFRL